MKSPLFPTLAPVALLALLPAVSPISLPAQTPPRAPSHDLAATPPMGWNSWDSYGTTINEAQFRASAAWVATHLKPAGYQYVTIDSEWFVANPSAAGNVANAHRTMDASGRYIPEPSRFPSSADGKGFAPLADYIHSLGLKFGIHVLQGIPKDAVAADPLIEGSTIHAKEAANIAAGCQWNPDNFDLNVTPAGQAYYDSLLRLYASWHVDLIKIDCIASRPYKGDEIRMFHEAIAKSGRPILLSLSPGEAPFDEAANLQQYSQQWRISDDIWDLWRSDKPYPQGLNDQFPRAAKWIETARPGHWPDADMLPLGRLGPAPGYGKPRDTGLTHDEQRSLFTLWSIFRSPLMYGGDPAATDAWALSLLTNPEVIAIDQHSRNNQSVILSDDLAVWTAQPPTDAKGSSDHYLAVFNRKDTPQTVTLPWTAVKLPPGPCKTLDLWTHTAQTGQASLNVTLAPHASTLLRVSPLR